MHEISWLRLAGPRLALTALCGAGLTPGHAAAQASTETTIDWPTFGGSGQRTGYNPSETTLSVASVPHMVPHWHTVLSSPIKVQPSLIRQVTTPSGTFDLLIVTLFNGVVEALDAATGREIWTNAIPQVTLNCRGPATKVGIGEPVTVDVANGIAYVVDGGGLLHALSVATGVEQTGYPIEVIDAANLAADTWVHFASPTLVGQYLYIGTAAFCESESIPFHGQIIQFDIARSKVLNRFYPMGNGSALGGDFWGVGGVAVDPDGPFLWGATGNTLPAPQTSGNAEKVVKLGMNLKLVAENGPVLPPGGDLDFGSTPLLFQPPGCPPLLAVENKMGIMVVYNRKKLSTGPIQTISMNVGGGNSKFFGMPAYDPTIHVMYVTNPQDSQDKTYLRGLVALKADTTCKLTLEWQQNIGEGMPVGIPAPPTVANGVVYFAESLVGQIAAFNASSGAPLWNSGTTVPQPSTVAPVVANGQLFVVGGNTMFAFGL